MLSNCGAGEDYWESFYQQGNQTSQSKRESTPNIHWKDDAKVEAPILWPPHVKSQLIGKDPDAGKVWGQEKKGGTEDEMVGWHHQLNGHEFEHSPGMVKDRKPWRVAVHGVTKSWTQLHDWATTKNCIIRYALSAGFWQQKERILSVWKWKEKVYIDMSRRVRPVQFWSFMTQNVLENQKT